MDKRYQIFISSTFLDLQAERQAVLRAVLELDHMPAGMELFPAADDSAWQLIRDVIDNSDYYVLIIGGKYGSLDEAGLGYTEKEYDYAIESKKPVIPLLHKNPDSLPREKTETDSSTWERLAKFRTKVQKKHTCVYWNNADDLKAKVIVGLTTTTKRHPAIGWVRADRVPTEATLAEILALKSQIAALQVESAALRALRNQRPSGTDGLAQGDDTYEFHFWFKSVKRVEGDELETEHHSASISPTWNGIFAAVAPSMINEAANYALRHSFKEVLEREARASQENRKVFKDAALHDFEFRDDEIETCVIQLRALGLIKQSDRKRAIKDTGTYWTLTPYGNTLMVQLRAVRRKPSSEHDDLPSEDGGVFADEA
jgi:Domain of unknown function (DUF4062)